MNSKKKMASRRYENMALIKFVANTEESKQEYYLCERLLV
jgi:hypothetical protein